MLGGICNKTHILGYQDGRMREQLLSIENHSDYRWAFKLWIGHVINYKDGYLMSRYDNKALIG